jgi:hypothetical protein
MALFLSRPASALAGLSMGGHGALFKVDLSIEAGKEDFKSHWFSFTEEFSPQS